MILAVHIRRLVAKKRNGERLPDRWNVIVARGPHEANAAYNFDSWDDAVLFIEREANEEKAVA